MRHWRYLLVLTLATAALMLAPIPSKHVVRVTAKLLARSGGTALLGPSTIDEHSKCDTDQRTIAQMLAADLGTPVRDVSDGGQTPDEAMSFATLALKMPWIERVVLVIDTSYLSHSVRLNWSDAAFFRVMSHDVFVGVPGSYFDILKSYGGEVARPPAIAYDGSPLPSYAELAATWFPDEKRRMTCPENDGHDLRMVKGITYHEQVQPQFDPDKAAMLEALTQIVRGTPKPVLVVLLPIDEELILQFDPDWPNLVRRRLRAAKLAMAGLPVLDLSTALPKQDFIDRWCGCLHLSAHGRRIVAAAIAERMQAF